MGFETPELDLKKLTVEAVDAGHMRITFPNDFSYVRLIRKTCIDFVKDTIVDANIIFQMEILIDEVCNNSIEHGSPIYKLAKIIVDIWRDADFVRIRVQDSGKGSSEPEAVAADFSPEIVREREDLFRELKEIRRGRGLLLVKELSSSFDINLDPVHGSMIEFCLRKK